jgi:hypothetical protein
VYMDKSHTLKAVFKSVPSQQLYLIVRGMDSRIYYRSYGGSWGNWSRASTGSTSDRPAALLINGRLYLAVKGSDGSSIWFGVLDPATSSVSWSKVPGSTPSAPSLAADSTGRIYLVVRGMDNGIYINTYYNGWQGWKRLPGSTVNAPAAVILNGIMHIVVIGGDGRSIWHGQLNLSSNNLTWKKISGSTQSAPSLTTDGKNLYLAVRGMDNKIYINVWDGAWKGWSPVPTGSTSASPAVSILNGVLHVVVKGSSDTSIWHCYRDQSGYSKWTKLSGSTNVSPTLSSP